MDELTGHGHRAYKQPAGKSDRLKARSCSVYTLPQTNKHSYTAVRTWRTHAHIQVHVCIYTIGLQIQSIHLKGVHTCTSDNCRCSEKNKTKTGSKQLSQRWKMK